ncbi:protein LAX PANICLE [Salix suchowensis]|nr:protein LAX PANICLE [Salix suchowensis]
MASSSHKIHTGYDFSRPFEGGEEDREWLQLGLGICRKRENNMEQSKYTVPAVSSSLLHFQARQQIGHSLGLELGLGIVGLDDNGGVRRDKDVAPVSDYNHKSSLCQHNQGQEDHDYNLDLTARLSSPSWPLHMISSGSTGSFLGWKMPVSNASHNCSSLPPPPLFSPTTTRPHLVGLWFTLSSTINREGEALPQIPKAYIRVKDENVTVFMVKKYLVRKLGLANEDEIEISCMGQKLRHAQTLQQVRDAIWLPGLVDSVNSAAVTLENSLIDGSILHQLMSLQYHVPCGV